MQVSLHTRTASPHCPSLEKDTALRYNPVQSSPQLVRSTSLRLSYSASLLPHGKQQNNPFMLPAGFGMFVSLSVRPLPPRSSLQLTKEERISFISICDTARYRCSLLPLLLLLLHMIMLMSLPLIISYHIISNPILCCSAHRYRVRMFSFVSRRSYLVRNNGNFASICVCQTDFEVA